MLYYVYLENKLSCRVLYVLGIRESIEKANQEAFKRLNEASSYWIDVGIARDVINGFKDYMLLHAGPPISWDRASGPLRGALIGAVLYEGWCDKPEDAIKLLERGEVVLEPTHKYGVVAPMAGVVSPSMPVMVFYDRVYGNKSYTNLNEGLGRVLRYGAYGEDVIERLVWLREKLYPVLKAVVDDIRRDNGIGLDFKSIIMQSLHMDDECHNRNVAANALFLKEITPYLLGSGIDKSDVVEVYKFIAGNKTFTLNMSMATAKLLTIAAHNIKYSTIVTVISRNGTDVGIWVSGLGDEWITTPAPVPKGLFFPGYSQEDANPDIGDSSITETAGFGGFAMASAPAIVSYIGGSVDYLVEANKMMYEITVGENKYFTIPYLGFRGTPTGIDVRLVLRKGITPVINTGIAHKEPGIGQVGAGIVELPIELFKKALRRFAEKYGL